MRNFFIKVLEEPCYGEYCEDVCNGNCSSGSGTPTGLIVGLVIAGILMAVAIGLIWRGGFVGKRKK